MNEKRKLGKGSIVEVTFDVLFADGKMQLTYQLYVTEVHLVDGREHVIGNTLTGNRIISFYTDKVKFHIV